MRFIFKTDYAQDIKLAKHGGHVFWYGLLVLLLIAAPWIIAEYWLAQLTFILIYAIAGLGLMLLAGFTGQFSLGHAAFLGVGAYTQAVFTNMGVPFPIALALAAALSAAAQGHLSRYCHHLFWFHRRGSVCALGVSHRRQFRHPHQSAGYFWLEVKFRHRVLFAVFVYHSRRDLRYLELAAL
jgi:Branched-chain amino acid transport system / permease component